MEAGSTSEQLGLDNFIDVKKEHEVSERPAIRESLYGPVGASPGMHALYGRLAMVGAASGNLLILGETGSGKELVARAFHESSPHRSQPFVALNCSALAKDPNESELFGYKRGAIRGANSDQLGLFRSDRGRSCTRGSRNTHYQRLFVKRWLRQRAAQSTEKCRTRRFKSDNLVIEAPGSSISATQYKAFTQTEFKAGFPFPK